MGTIIAINGKGGTGKTTIASLVVERLVQEKKGSVLAIDADPNSCFSGMLGVEKPDTIVGMCEELSKQMDRIPAGMTKERFIALKIQEAIVETDSFDLLVMGRPEGPGCYCYVNNLLRGLIGGITKNYDFVVIDNAAGMEHISRRTMGSIDLLLLVSDYSINGVRSTKKIHDLAVQMNIAIGRACVIINRVDGPLDALADEIRLTGLALAGEIPYSREVVAWNVANRPIFEFDDALIKERVAMMLQKVAG